MTDFMPGAAAAAQAEAAQRSPWLAAAAQAEAAQRSPWLAAAAQPEAAQPSTRLASDTTTCVARLTADDDC